MGDFAFCPTCGTKPDGPNLFCVKCGRRFEPTPRAIPGPEPRTEWSSAKSAGWTTKSVAGVGVIILVWFLAARGTFGLTPAVIANELLGLRQTCTVASSEVNATVVFNGPGARALCEQAAQNAGPAIERFRQEQGTLTRLISVAVLGSAVGGGSTSNGPAAFVEDGTVANGPLVCSGQVKPFSYEVYDTGLHMIGSSWCNALENAN